MILDSIKRTIRIKVYQSKRYQNQVIKSMVKSKILLTSLKDEIAGTGAHLVRKKQKYQSKRIKQALVMFQKARGNLQEYLVCLV